MFAIFIKEINGFFSSLTGYIVIVVFLCQQPLHVGLSGSVEYTDSGYAGLDTLFLAPWIFLFLVQL